jgi:hypothetical protein
MNKKGMEVWQIVLMILALLFLAAFLFFYGQIGEWLKGLFANFGRLF